MEEELLSLRTAVEFAPDNLRIRLIFAETLFTAQDYKDARKNFKRALQIQPNALIAKCGLAKCYYNLQEFSVSYVILEEICALEETPAEYHLLFARLLEKEDQRDEALTQYAKAIIKDPSLERSEYINYI